MERPKRFGLASMVMGVVAIGIGLMGFFDSEASMVIFAVLNIVIGSSLFVIGFGQYRGWKSLTRNH